MTIKIFVLKGDRNGKIVVVRFFFCWVYVARLEKTPFANPEYRSDSLKTKLVKSYNEHHLCSLVGREGINHHWCIDHL